MAETDVEFKIFGQPPEHRITVWPLDQNRRNNMVSYIMRRRLTNPEYYQRNGGSTIMTPETAEAEATRIESEAYDIFGDVPGTQDSGFTVFKAYWCRINRECKAAINSIVEMEEEEEALESANNGSNKSISGAEKAPPSGTVETRREEEGTKNAFGIIDDMGSLFTR